VSPERIRPGSARIRPGSAGAQRQAPVKTPEPSAQLDVEPSPQVPETTTGAEASAILQAPKGVGVEPAPLVSLPEMDEESPGEEQEATTGIGNKHDGRPDKKGRQPTPALPRRPGPFARLYYGQTRVDFVRRKRWWFAFSSAVILAGVLSLATRGLNLGIDFVGGNAWTIQSKSFTVTQARNAITPLGLGGATITVLGQNSSSRTVEVQAKLPKGQTSAAMQAERASVTTALARAAHVPQEAVSTATVGPSWGSEITHKAIVALIVFFILIALYISVFFEWRMALAAIAAVAHDVLVTVGIYSLTGFQVTPDTVVAFLTILGYSLYDTIVVFDRVRDNVKRLGPSGKLTFSDLVNLSMNQTLARSINTSLVAILPILSVLILGAYVLGATTLEYFGLALLIGLTTGAYSSIFIASPLVALLKEREPRYRNIRAKLAQRGGDRLVLSPADIAAGVLGQDLEPGPRPVAPEASRRSLSRPGRNGGRQRPQRAPSPARRRGGRR
jgi:preprotein translocase subunit SecF